MAEEDLFKKLFHWLFWAGISFILVVVGLAIIANDLYISIILAIIFGILISEKRYNHGNVKR